VIGCHFGEKFGGQDERPAGRHGAGALERQGSRSEGNATIFGRYQRAYRHESAAATGNARSPVSYRLGAAGVNFPSAPRLTEGDVVIA
jgi:hypothetical protein